MTESNKDARNDYLNIEVIQEFSSRTSLHGINSIAKSKTRTGRIVWSVLLVLAFGYTVNSTVRSFIRYTHHPFTTEVSEQFAGNFGLKFPAITICPMNMFVKRKIELQDDNPMFHKYGLNLEVCKGSKVLRKKFNMTCGMLLICTTDVPEFLPEKGCWVARKIMSALSMSRKNLSQNFEEEFRKRYGPDLRNSVVMCRFGRGRCIISNFREYVTKYGNCFQLNGNIDSATYSFVKDSLTMILDAKVGEYTKSPCFTEGFKFYIHDQGTFNSPERGFVVSPGKMARVDVKQRKMIYLESPFKSNCTNRKLQSYPTYTIEGCLNECYQNLLQRLCGCRTCGYILNNGSQDIRVCTANDTMCKRRLVRSHFDPKGCDCPPPCKQTTYPYQVSYSSFPDPGTTSKMSKHRQISFEYQRANLVAISIFYQATSYEMQEQKESYRLEALLGELGGNLGLMVGCSVLTAAEILQLIGLLIYNCLCKWCQRRKRKVAWLEGP